MTERLRLASLACFASALLGGIFLPSFFLPGWEPLPITIPLVSVLLLVFYMMTLKSWLERKLGYYRAGTAILFLVVAHIGIAVSSVLDEISVSLITVSGGMAVGSSLLLGLSGILLGIRILEVRHHLGRFGVLYAVLIALEGFFFGTVAFIAVGIQVAVLADVVLGILLLRLAARDRGPVALTT